MARQHHLIFGLILLGLSLGVTKSYAQIPFEPGEKLVYNVRWGVIPIGQASLWVRNLGEYQGKKVYHITAEGKSNAFLSVFYEVHDLVQTLWDAEKFHTLAFQKIQNEGHYHTNEIYLFDHGAKKVKWFNSKRHEKDFQIPIGVQDAISCLYQFRRMGDGSFKNLKMDVCQDEKNYVLTVHSVEPETVKVKPLGRVKTLKVIPYAKHKGMFLREGTMWVWFTRDEKRIPVRVQVKAPIFGRLSADLVEIENVLEPQPSTITEQIRLMAETKGND